MKLVEGVLSPVSTLLDVLFSVGALYGAKTIAKFSWKFMKGLRTYFIPFGRLSRKDLSSELGKWALIAGGTSGIGLAFAHEVVAASEPSLIKALYSHSLPGGR